MKNKLIVCIGLLLILTLLMGCSRTISLLLNEPPNAEGKVNGQKIEFIKGAYQWNNTIADTGTPDQVVKNRTVYEVKPNAQLTLNFNGSKPSEVSAELWSKEHTSSLETQGEAFLLPSEPGLYVLNVWGKWSGNNRASYIAAIEVKE